MVRMHVCLVVFLGTAAAAVWAEGSEEARAKAAARQAMIARIDELVAARIKAAGFEPAEQASDEEFLRRIYLDLTGAIPRVSEARAFLADKSPDKRARLIDTLLDSPAHATHLANTWRNIMPTVVS